jgi:hypothetical protein
MPIATPLTNASRTSSKPHSDFVLCQDFVFRPGDVDGFSHVTEPDSDPLTVVNFKAFTQSIPDPEKRLFSFLMRKLKPRSIDETA